jgi:hypothetical protein
MKSKLLLALILLIAATGTKAEDLRKLLSLSGNWMFSIGDDMQWASPAYDDSKWDRINVPDKWEDQGYEDYNGYAWYRKEFRPADIPKNVQVILMLGRIDDADAVYLNGKLLARSGDFPPYPETAYDRTRRYVIPDGLLKEDAENVIAVRVYDGQQDGGIVDGPVGLFYDADVEFMNLNLTGKWKIHAGDNKEWKEPGFNDNDWKRIQVPSEWETGPLHNYDGYAWYRVNFRVPANFTGSTLYLSLGKIDDVDDVYLNGKYIGSVYDIRTNHRHWGDGWEWNVRRVYKISGSWLKPGEINNIAVRVYDGQGAGGIYQGPVGIMSPENYRRFKDKHPDDDSFWYYIFRDFYER